MPDWIDHTHAGFVLAAYGVAGVALLSLGVVSWRAYRQAKREALRG